MNEDEFERYVLEKLDCIDKKIADVRERLAKVEANWIFIKRLAMLLVSAIAAKLGLDLTGLV